MQTTKGRFLMKFLIDTANLNEIKRLYDFAPLSGVTTNPSIIKNEGNIDFYNHINDIRHIIGSDQELHVQVVATDYESIIKDAEAILNNVDQDVFIKIPVTKDGIKAIRELKAQGINITATAIYTKFQAYLAIAADVDYIAPYYNRMENLNINPIETISAIAQLIKQSDSSTKILAASFKNVNQVNTAFEIGAQAATMSVDIIEMALSMPSIAQAVDVFKEDFEKVYGIGETVSTVCSLTGTPKVSKIPVP